MNFMKKENLAQVLSCKFFKLSKNTFFTECLWATAYAGRKNGFSHDKVMPSPPRQKMEWFLQNLSPLSEKNIFTFEIQC